MIEVLLEKCVGCGACLSACAYNAIKIEEKFAVIDPEVHFMWRLCFCLSV